MSLKLPVLFVTDVVVLPGMVVPLELDESSQAATDALDRQAFGPSGAGRRVTRLWKTHHAV